jgi:hypothetical protein
LELVGTVARHLADMKERQADMVREIAELEALLRPTS